MKLLNTTTQKQQVMYVGGDGDTILPGEEIVVDISKVYPHEIERISRIFKVLVEVPEKEEPKIALEPRKKRSYNSDDKEEKEGGTD